MKKRLLSALLLGVAAGCAQVAGIPPADLTPTPKKTPLNQKTAPDKNAKTPPSSGVRESKERAAHGLDTVVEVTTYSATKIDLSCENVFESVSLVENFFRLAAPTATNYLSGVVGGQSQLSDKQLKLVLTSLSHQMVWLPISAEEKYGEWLHNDMLSHGKILEPKSLKSDRDRENLQKIEQILIRIIGNLPSDSPFKFQLHVSTEEGVNAYANPAGYVYVTRDLLKSADMNAITFMLAHEIAHVTKRHKIKEHQVQLVDGVTGLSEMRTILSSGNPANLVAALSHANTLKTMFDGYSIAQESEADGCAIRLLANQPNIDVVKAAQGFLKKQKGLAKGKKQTHPTYSNRQQLISDAYSKFGSTRYVGDKTPFPQHSDANVSPLKVAQEKNSELLNGKQEQSQGLFQSVGNLFSSDNKKTDTNK